jgi:pimeloyl-ACP methyl ester carboxylesterase
MHSTTILLECSLVVKRVDYRCFVIFVDMRLCFVLLVSTIVSCAPKPDDRFTTILGKSQHILDAGKGEPAVVFISGFGDRVSSWMKVQPKIAEQTRTLSYDRGGLGESKITGKNRSLDSLVFELNEILKTEKFKMPVILVGHSYGGHIARYFAHKHPESVAGILLVDPSVEFMDEEFKRLKNADDIRKYDSLKENGKDPNWSEGVRNEADYFQQNTNVIKTISFNDKTPTTVITAINTPAQTLEFLKGANEMKVTLHKNWVLKSPYIRHLFANTGHYVQFDDPELVIKEITRLISQVRTTR